MSGTLSERVDALVTDEGHRLLLERLRRRLERGGDPATVLLRGLGREERRALADLLGRSERAGGEVRVSIEELDAALRSSRIGAGLLDVLEAWGGPLGDQRAERRATQRAWDELFSDLVSGVDVPPWRHEWVEALRRGTLRRLTGDVDGARHVTEQALRVLGHLPSDGTQLADLAARATGDPHALDPGRGPLPVLVLSAVAVQLGLPPDQPTAARDRRDLWAAVGVRCDPLSVTTLVHGLRVHGGGLLGETLRAHADAGEPLRLTLRQLVDVSLTLPDGVLYVCENPSIVAAAADDLGAGCAPLVCVEGIPSSASHALLDALGQVGLRVHVDFDSGGIRIANLLHRRVGATPWRLGVDDYLAGVASVEHAIPLGGPIDDAEWDDALANAMRESGKALHEEQVLEVLLADLGRHSGSE